ncbi:MAG: hybrid sensor histidine kinase/response regulator [Cyanobacteria bacterium J069]|nr:MAG: hybrid sensor histidine kinase/response regulator [Cyanobacteria bacterium J069]
MDVPLNLLVVDDDEIDRMAVRRSLRHAGVNMTLTEAGDYATAIAALQERPYDCVFLDYRLPDRDGLAVVQEVRGRGDKTPLIVLTGQGDEEIAVELMKAGASDYLPKSKVSPEVLARILRNAIRIYQAELQVDRANRQREQLARQREDFVSRLTHDLRTPLVAADRMLKLFKQDAFGETTPEMSEAIAIMIRGNQNLLQMVNTLLEVYRHDAGEKNMMFDTCYLPEILREVYQELTPWAQDKQLSLTLANAVENGGAVMGDRLELRRLFINLIGNGIKFTDRGSVTVRLSLIAAPDPPPSSGVDDAAPDTASNPAPDIAFDTAPLRQIMVEVQDTGPGISPADQAILFDRYRQGNHKRAGSGLGLYLSRRIVEAHNGAITVSSAVGQGSTFTVRLPLKH